MVRRPSTGFTLVELLVVITIIGILMALLLPAVNFAVENARQRSCMNNQRQLALACTTFDSSKQRFPGYTNRMAYRHTDGTTKYKQAPWFVEIAPNMEKQDVYESWQSALVGATPYIDFMVCASDPPDSNDQPYSSYVGNGGYQDTANEHFSTGIMHNYCPDPVAGTKGPSITATQVSDGLTNTLLISENIQATFWNATNKHASTFVWWASDDANRRINANKTSTTTDNTTARPSANHPGGVNVAFADGHTAWLRQDIAYHVYVQLMTTRHKDMPTGISVPVAPNYPSPPEPVDWRKYVLSEADYK